MKKYESPKIKFDEIKLSSAIANQCWKWAKKDGEDPCYYNTSGKGYIRFNVSGKNNCSSTKGLNVQIAEYIGVEDQGKALAEFNQWWSGFSVPPHGSNFQGTNYTEDPTPPWSK